MTKPAAMYKFYSAFGLSAFEENAVPSDVEYPYLTYELLTDSFGAEVALSFSIWYRSESWTEINAKEKEISEAIGRGGKYLPCDGGAIWLKRGTPFAQRMGDDSDELVKRIYFNVSAEFLTAD